MNRSSTEIIGSFLFGAVVGAIAGIMLTPASGKETREKLGNWMEDNKEVSKAKLKSLEEEIKRRKDQLFKKKKAEGNKEEEAKAADEAACPNEVESEEA